MSLDEAIEYITQEIRDVKDETCFHSESGDRHFYTSEGVREMDALEGVLYFLNAYDHLRKDIMATVEDSPTDY